MKFAKRLGISNELFCKSIIRVKMFGMVAVMGHVAEYHYERYLDQKKIKYEKAGTDNLYDYLLSSSNDRVQVKRWDSGSTDSDKIISANLTKTHGNRKGENAYYLRDAFDTLVLYDIGFQNFIPIQIDDIPRNKKYQYRLPNLYKANRENALTTFQKQFLGVIKTKNKAFVPAIEKLRGETTYVEFTKNLFNMTLDELDTLFTRENFRLVTAAKGFIAEEHLNQFFEKNNITYEHELDMYSKVDHYVTRDDKTLRIQCKTPHMRTTDESCWGFKTHKTHGSGIDELYNNDEFDLIALFVGYKYGQDPYVPTETESNFVFIPTARLQRHPSDNSKLKRINKIDRNDAIMNDLHYFK